jgi:hypothetical protein
VNNQIAHGASRPRGRIWAQVALLLVAVSVAAGCPSPEKRRLGETFDIGTVSYTVKGKEVRSQIRVGGSTMEAGRGASFVLISYVIANHGKDYAPVNPLALRLVTADHTVYDVDLPATYALRMESMLGSSGESGSGTLAAGGSGSYTAVFRVPDDVARQKLNVVIRGHAVVAIE